MPAEGSPSSSLDKDENVPPDAVDPGPTSDSLGMEPGPGQFGGGGEMCPGGDNMTEFAAELSARLNKLPADSCCQPDYESPYENPSSMETQGQGQQSDPPSVESLDPIDMDMNRWGR